MRLFRALERLGKFRHETNIALRNAIDAAVTNAVSAPTQNVPLAPPLSPLTPITSTSAERRPFERRPFFGFPPHSGLSSLYFSVLPKNTPPPLTASVPAPFDDPHYVITIIGYGSLAMKLVEGLRRFGYKGRILVTGRDQEKLRKKAKLHDVECASNEQAATEANIIIVGTKPDMVAKVLTSIRTQLAQRPDVPVISLAAALRIDSIRQAVGQNNTPLLRVMTTTASALNLGAAQIYPSPNTAAKDCQLVDRLFHMLGITTFVETEEMMDEAVAIACSPAFFLATAESMQQALIAQGWSEGAARRAIAQTMKGAAEIALRESDIKKEINAVATKGGLTESELKIFEEKKTFFHFQKAYEQIALKCKNLGEKLAISSTPTTSGIKAVNTPVEVVTPSLAITTPLLPGSASPSGLLPTPKPTPVTAFTREKDLPTPEPLRGPLL